MNIWKKFKMLFGTLILSVFTFGTAHAVPISADVISIVDESGSMNTEHGWLSGMIGALESGLLGAGVGTGAQTNRYGLTGFGNITHDLPGGIQQEPHKHLVGGGDFGSATDFGTATGGLNLYGGFEDGWAGVNYAMNNYTFNPGAALNMILVTDEDRDNSNSALSYASVLNDLTSQNALLNAVVNASFRCEDQSTALGMDSAGNGYKADGSGGFTTCTGATAIYGPGNTLTNYVDLALASGGAAWDLNQLRAGGLTADSFTAAFVDIKVGEIIKPPQVPEPGSLALIGLGLAGLGWTNRRKKA